MIKTVYMITNGRGEFSTGGESPRFTKKGKQWTNRGHVSSHLNIAREKYGDHVYVVEYEVVHTEVNSTPVKDWTITPAAARAKARHEAQLLEYHRDRLQRQADHYEKRLKEARAELGKNPKRG